jgi:quercetin dioxygenase-like cupin family protein
VQHAVRRIVDMPPGRRSPMHRTSSLDYGIVISGEVHLELDEGRTVKLVAGDVVVQRGTIHAWDNRSSDFARMAFVLISAAPYLHDGKELAPEHR